MSSLLHRFKAMDFLIWTAFFICCALVAFLLYRDYKAKQEYLELQEQLAAEYFAVQLAQLKKQFEEEQQRIKAQKL